MFTCIEDMYPGLNGRPLRNTRKFSLNSEQGEPYSRLWLTMQPEYTGEPVQTLSPFFEAEIHGLLGAYEMAHGMGDCCGFQDLSRLSELTELESDGLISIKTAAGCLTFLADRHDVYRIIFRITRKQERFFLSCDFLLEGTAAAAAKLPQILVIETGTMAQQLAKAAAIIGEAMQHRSCMPPAYHWCSWYYCYHNFDLVQLKEYLDGFAGWAGAKNIRYFQLDVGYCPSIGDWLLPNERYPSGLKEAFDLIKAYGYEPGIWIGPFMVGCRSCLYREHPDWVLKNPDGTPYIELITDNEPKIWGYQDEEHYVLDTSHPDAMDYMRTVFKTWKSYGAAMYKTDFMLWGIQDSSKVIRHTPGKTSVEYFREFLQVIREEIGDDSYWLGCIAPFFPFIGYADGMRIGGDVGSSWRGEFGPQNMIRSLYGNLFTNFSFYQIDPDAVMLRDFHIRLTQAEIESLAIFAAMSGGCIYTSDPLHKIAANRRELFSYIAPGEIKRRARTPFLDQIRDDLVLIQDGNDRSLIFVFNQSDRDLTNAYSLAQLGLSPGSRLADAYTGAAPDLIHDKFYLTLPPHGHRLLLAKTALSRQAECEIDGNSLWGNLN